MNIFCQYSFRGFNIFRLENVDGQYLQETDAGCLPSRVIKYLGNNYTKFVFEKLSDESYMLLISDIISNEKDTNGGNKLCDLVVVFNPNESQLAYRFLRWSLMNIKIVESHFAGIFESDTSGIRYNGSDIYRFIGGCEDVEPVWCSVRNTENIFLVIKGTKFGRDETYTTKLIDDLSLPDFSLLRGHYITKDSLLDKCEFYPSNEISITKKQDSQADSITSVLSSIKKEFEKYTKGLVVVFPLLLLACVYFLVDRDSKDDTASIDDAKSAAVYNDTIILHRKVGAQLALFDNSDDSLALGEYVVATCNDSYIWHTDFVETDSVPSDIKLFKIARNKDQENAISISIGGTSKENRVCKIKCRIRTEK